jgi:NAD(P)H-nitrite reductase large subunit
LKNSDIVCKCFSVTVSDVLDHIKLKPNLSPIDRLKDLKIGLKCGDCLNINSSKIDVHFSSIFSLK